MAKISLRQVEKCKVWKTPPSSLESLLREDAEGYDIAGRLVRESLGLAPLGNPKKKTFTSHESRLHVKRVSTLIPTQF